MKMSFNLNIFFQNPGRLKLQSNSVIFKNNKTGKVEQFPGIEVETSEWLKRARGHCLKFRLNSGNVHRFDGFKDDVCIFLEIRSRPTLPAEDF